MYIYIYIYIEREIDRYTIDIPYLFKVNKTNTRIMCEICLSLTKKKKGTGKTPTASLWCLYC